ncbi:hypothetical protein QTP88_008909 [Uroleucon formosanum]
MLISLLNNIFCLRNIVRLMTLLYDNSSKICARLMLSQFIFKLFNETYSRDKLFAQFLFEEQFSFKSS